MFRRVFRLTGIMLVVGLLVGTAALGAEKEELTEVEFPQITVVHPSGWFGMGNLEEAFVLLPVLEEQKDFTFNVNFMLETGVEYSLEQILEEYQEEQEGIGIEDFSLQKTEEIVIDDHPGDRIIFSGFMPDLHGEELQWMQYFVLLEEEKYLIITYAAEKENFEYYREEVEEIIKKTRVH